MTVSTQTAKVQYTGNGVTTAFTGSFPILDQTHITVIQTVGGVDTTLALTTNYTVSGVGGSTFTVTCLVAPPSGARLTIARSVPLTQELDLVENGPLPSTELEKSYDKLTMIAQQTKETSDRAIKIPLSDPSTTGTTFPNVAARANKLAGFDATGAPTAYDASVIATTGAVYADYIRTQYSGDGTTTVFTLPADPLSRDNVNIFISGVYQNKDRFSVSGTVLTFVVAPPSGTNNIEVVQGQGLLATAAPPPDNSVTTASIADSAVTTAKIADSNVTNAKLANMAANTVKVNATAGSAAPTDLALAASQLLGRGSTGNVAAIALGTNLSMSGATLNVTAAGLTLGTPVATTSGTAIDFTGIPTARVIYISLNGVSTNGTSVVAFRIGCALVDATGYLGSSVFASTGAAVNNTTYFGVEDGGSGAAIRHGVLVLTLLNSSTNLWGYQAVVGRSDIASVTVAAGSKSLSGALDRVRLTTVGGTDTFDAGSMNISWL